MGTTYDFSGWATRNNLLCSDGRTIRQDAFKHNDGETVPLVWNHQWDTPGNVLGHALLENRPEGVYAYGKFNDTEEGQKAKQLIEHGDIRSLSIFANKLKHVGNDVIHGTIREVSLVLAGANPGAFIDSVLAHGDTEEEGIIAGYDENIMLYHAEDQKKDPEPEPDVKDKTKQDIINSMTEEQQNVLFEMVGAVLDKQSTEEPGDDDTVKHSSLEEPEGSAINNNSIKGGDNSMKHNVFDKGTATTQENVLSHDAMETIIKDGKKYGSLKESFLAHADTYGITNIDYLFPDAKTINNTPEFISRNMDWVQKVMAAVHKTPFSRIKSIFADITADEARAKGYIKGKLKKEEVFTLLKRTTTPTTIYKKQKIDRDDVIDITDFDVIAWLKSEMRVMLDEEIARAILVGDGRLASSDDKIKEDCIRPIWTDADLYTVKKLIEYAAAATDDDKADAFITAIIKSRKEYKGSGNPVLFTTEDQITNCLLMKDKVGRKIYNSVTELATALRVSEIIAVEVMEGLTRENTDGNTVELLGIMVNLKDYNVGADKGGAIGMFDDFDIDYNQQKYLIETRCSGALVKPFSAIVIEAKTAAAEG